MLQEAADQAIDDFNPPEKSSGLDAGCGIGQAMVMLGNIVGKQGQITGLDSSESMLKVAEELIIKSDAPDIFDFKKGDLLALPFEDRTFNWIWCKDSFWPGPIIKDPVKSMKEFARVVLPGGSIGICFWSAQSLLCGYPRLEARLTNKFVETAPYTKDCPPNNHYMKAMGWMRAAGLVEVRAKSFVTGACAPLSSEISDSIELTIRMFFDDLENKVDAEDWTLYQQLVDPESDKYLPGRPDYYCFLTYTLFTGKVPG